MQMSLTDEELLSNARDANSISLAALDELHSSRYEVAAQIPFGRARAGIGLAPFARAKPCALSSGSGLKEANVLAKRPYRSRAAGSAIDASRGDASNELTIKAPIATQQRFIATTLVVDKRRCG